MAEKVEKQEEKQDEMLRYPVEFQITNHGPYHAQYFPGHGISHTSFEHCVTGCGGAPDEALTDALEQLAMAGEWDIDPIEKSLEAEEIFASNKDAHDDCEPSFINPPEDWHDECEMYWYVSVDIRVRGHSMTCSRPERKSWDTYFMDIAKQVATRSTCDRLSVGAVLVRDRQILSTGYNGSVRGANHCDTVGHMLAVGHRLVDGGCKRTVHAEANAIVQAAYQGIRIGGAVLYVTHSPCFECAKLIVNAGISYVSYAVAYRDREPLAFLIEAGVKVIGF